MRKKFTLKTLSAILLFGWIIILQSSAQTSVFQSTSRKIVYAYEGFDYFGGIRVPGQFGQVPTSRPLAPANPVGQRATEAAQATNNGLSLHNINTFKSNTNSYFSLGWASDWVASNAGSTPYRLSTTPLENIITSPKNPIAAPPNTGNEKFSLVNAGFYATTAAAGGGTIGRRLQTSTGGYFYEYEIFNEVNQNSLLDASYTDAYWYSNGINARDRFVRTLPQSTIRTLTSSTGAIHKVSEATGPLPVINTDPLVAGNKYTGRTYTTNTSIGAEGSTIWLGFLMRLKDDPANNEDAYINLHLNNLPYQVNTNKLSIGYFGTTDPASFGTGATKRWGVRVGSNAYVSSLPLGSPADSSTIRPGKFTLLVVSITFNYTGNNTVKLFTINDDSKYYDDITGDGMIDEPAIPVGTFSIGGDLSFHSLAYYGGGSIGRSDIDEIRFARSFDLAALASQTVSLIRDLCESDLDGDGRVDGTVGTNVNQGGDLGYVDATASAYDASSPGGDQVLLSEVTGGEFVGTSDPYDQTYGAFNDPNLANSAEHRVMFEAASTPFAGTTYGALSPGFNYRPNASGHPNDGNYYIGTQSRNPFGTSWIWAYDNSGDRLGNMMVVNAAYDRSIFFQQEVSGICAGTQYEFYADVLNLFQHRIKSVTNLSAPTTNYNCGCYPELEPGCGQFSMPGTDQRLSDGLGAASRTGDWLLPAGVTATQECFALNPEIEFLIDGVSVYIPPISINNDEKWHRIGFTFVTKDPPNGTVTIAVRNRAPGGNGNDLAMDNFIFRPCGPSLNLVDPVLCLDPTKQVVQYEPKGKTYRKPYYRWVIKPPICQSNCNDPDPTKRVYCVSNCADLNNATYQSDNNSANWLIVGGQAFFDENMAELKLDTINRNTPGFTTTFPGGFIPPGTQIFAYSASESDANTADLKCRIQGAPASVICNFVTLPVDLLEFKARLETGMVRLDWKTQKEEKFKEFIIERSANGYDYTSIGVMGAKGKPINTYLFYDYTPIEGKSYYRLKIIDTNGQYSYSNIESISMNARYSVNPVPADDRLNISLIEENNKSRNVQIRLTNLLGNALFQQEYQLAPGYQNIPLSVASLQPGVYFLEIIESGNITKKRIVISR